MSLKNDLEMVDSTRIMVSAGGSSQLLVEGVGIVLNLQTKAAKEFLRVALANTLLMDRKQQDYGSRNISETGIFGVIVRMNDKMKRIINLFGRGKRRRANNEPAMDSFRDISNYANIGILLELERWPNE